MFTVKVQHRDQRAQVMKDVSFKQKNQAERFARQQIEIARTNGHKVGEVAGEFVVFTNDGDGTRQTTFWVSKVKA